MLVAVAVVLAIALVRPGFIDLGFDVCFRSFSCSCCRRHCRCSVVGVAVKFQGPVVHSRV